MVDRIEIAALMSAALGRTVEAGESPPPPVDPGTPAMQQGFARMTAHYDAHGFPGGNALVLRAVLGREPRTLAQVFSEQATALKSDLTIPAVTSHTADVNGVELHSIPNPTANPSRG